MAKDPGEWYAERAAEAERLEHELAGARQVLAAIREARGAGSAVVEAAILVVQRLTRELERARYVGD